MEIVGRVLNGELLLMGISALNAPLSNFHLKAVHPQRCGVVVPQLKVPPGPTVRVALVLVVVPLGSPLMAMPWGCKPPRLSPPNPAPIAGDPGKSCAACRNCATVTFVAGVPASTPKFRRGSTT